MSSPDSAGTADALPPLPLQPGETLGRYELLSLLSTGALGDLWRGRIATGPEVGRAVAIRRIRRAGVLDAGAVERLTNVGFAAMELRHSKIAAVLDFVVSDAEMAVVSEHIPGAQLSTVLRPPPGGGGMLPRLPVGAAVRIALDVLEALDAVAAPWAEIAPDSETEAERRLRAGIHGGVAPEGVLVAGFGETMLLEVGVTGVAFSIPALGEHVDALAYRAPELLDGKVLPDARSDVFAVGVLLWELIAGRSLFGAPALLPRPGGRPAAPLPRPGNDPAQASTLRRKLQSAPVQRLDAMPLLKGKVTREVADFVARALSRDPAARFQTIREAVGALERAPVSGARDHAAVAEWVKSAGLAEEPVPREPYRPPLESNRPTLPPAEDRSKLDTLPPTDAAMPSDAPALSAADTVRRAVVAPQIILSAKGTRSGDSLIASKDVESVPPSGRESAFVSSADVESLAPPSSTLPPVAAIAGADIESVPPSSMSVPPLDVESVPPSAAPAPVARAGVASVGAAAGNVAFPPVGAGAPFPVTTAAPSPSVQAEAFPGDSDTSVFGVLSPSRPSRPPTGKRVVIAAAAALVGVVVIAALAFSGSDDDGSAQAASSAEPARSAPPATPATAVVAPAPSGAPADGAEPPTSAPPPVVATAAGSPLEPGSLAQPKKPLKKKPYRPTGI